MPSIELPGGATISTTLRVTTTTVCAADKSPVSALAAAKSTSPAENAFAASNAVPLSITLRRTAEFVEAIRLARAAIIRGTSPSNEPAATVSVVGFEM